MTKFLVLYNSPVPADPEAGSLDDAVRVVADHPHVHTPDGSIDVLEFLQMPGMEG